MRMRLLLQHLVHKLNLMFKTDLDYFWNLQQILHILKISDDKAVKHQSSYQWL